MVNEVVGTGDWEDESSLGETWKGRNAYSYGRNEGSGAGGQKGTARPEVLDKLLATTERVVQEVDSVEYGLTDIQEYYANTGGRFHHSEYFFAFTSTTLFFSSLPIASHLSFLICIPREQLSRRPPRIERP